MKNGIVKILLFLFSLSLFCGCWQEAGEAPASSLSSKVSASSEEQFASSSTSLASSDITVQSSIPESVFWPQERMGDLPDPGGAIMSVNDSESGVRVAVGGISPGEAESYIQGLRELGYNAQAEGEDGQGGLMYSAVKDGYMVVVLYAVDGPDSDTGLCQISYEKTK